MDRLLLPLLVVFAVMALVWYLALRRLADRLRERHPDTYDELGLDEASWSEDSNRALLRFLSGKRHLRLRDPEVSRVAEFMHRLLWIFVVTMLVVVALGLHFAWPDEGEGPASPARAQAPAPPTNATAAQRREEAFTSHRGGRYAEAVKAYDDVERMAGYDGELLYWRAMAQWRLGRLEEAITDFRRLVQLDPTHFEVHQFLGRLLEQAQRRDEALEAWSRYISYAGSDPNGWFERAQVHRRKGNLGEAREDAKKACDLGQSGACAWLERLR